MPIEMRWLDDEHTINLWTLGETFAWEECYAVRQEIQVDGPYYVIVDCAQLQTVPTNSLGEIPRLIVEASKQLQFTVLAGVRPGFARTLAQVFASVYSAVRFAKTVDEGVELIRAEGEPGPG